MAFRFLVAMLIALSGSVALAQRSTPVQLLHPTGAAFDVYAYAVAIDGDTMIVGAYTDDVGANADQGSAHVYRWTGSGWAFEATLVAADGAANDQFGVSVAINGDTVVVGVYADDVGANADQGSAYIFTRSGTTWTQQAKITAGGGVAGDSFGISVAIASDTAIVGAHYADVGANADRGSAYIFTRSGTTWTQQAQLSAPGGAALDYFGVSVAVAGNTAVVGASLTDIGPNANRGSAFVFTRAGALWTLQAQLTASDGAADDVFGHCVALSGDTVIVGAYADDVGANTDQGSAYIFTRSGATWTQQARLTATDGAAGDNFGCAVALSGDTAVIGARYDDVGSNTDQGSACVFTRSGSTWTQQTQFTVPDGAASDVFGYSVAIFGDTDVIGAPGDDIGPNTNQGSVWVCSRIGSRWIGPDLKLVASDGAEGDYFGYSVAIDGDTAIVGAPGGEVFTYANQGSAYIFVRPTGGTTWTQQAKLTATGGAAGDNFGGAVAIAGDTAVIGALHDDINSNTDQGSAYIFVRPPGGSTWTQQAMLTASDGATSDQFGFSVAISGDTVIVGASADDTSVFFNQGSAYIFVRPTGGTTWTQQAKLTAADGSAVDEFGCSVALSGDTAIIGAGGDDVGANGNQGSAYVFVRPTGGTTWTQQAKLTAGDGAEGDEFGRAVALSGDTAVVGARNDDVGGTTDQGSAYVFDRFGTTWWQQPKLTASVGAAYDHFGSSVAISGDTAFVGAPGDDIGPTIDQGSAYLFVRTSNGAPWAIWTQQTRFFVFGGAALDQFGYGVALSGDTAVLAAPADDLGSSPDQGTAFAIDIPTTDFSSAQNTHNFSTNDVYPTLADAFIQALNGEMITATPAAWRTAATLDTLQRALDLRSSDSLRMPSTASLTLLGGSSLASAAGTSIELYGSFTLTGASLTHVNSFQLTLGTQAVLTAAPASGLDLVTGHFDCAISSNTRYDMSLATLQFQGSGAEQTLEVMSTDIGPAPSGLDRALAGHYPLGTLRIGPAPSTVRLVDTHDNDGLGQASCEAVYTDTLWIDAGSRLINPSCRIYYRTLLNGGTVDFPANLVHIVPPCPADLGQQGGIAGSDGLLDNNDFVAFIDAFFNANPAADLGRQGGLPSADGLFDNNDFVVFIDQFFAGC